MGVNASTEGPLFSEEELELIMWNVSGIKFQYEAYMVFSSLNQTHETDYNQQIYYSFLQLWNIVTIDFSNVSQVELVRVANQVENYLEELNQIRYASK